MIRARQSKCRGVRNKGEATPVRVKIPRTIFLAWFFVVWVVRLTLSNDFVILGVYSDIKPHISIIIFNR